MAKQKVTIVTNEVTLDKVTLDKGVFTWEKYRSLLQEQKKTNYSEEGGSSTQSNTRQSAASQNQRQIPKVTEREDSDAIITDMTNDVEIVPLELLGLLMTQVHQSPQVFQPNQPNPSPIQPLIPQMISEIKRTYKNPTKNLWKNFLKAYIGIVLNRRWEHFKSVIQSIEPNGGEEYAELYKRHLQNIEIKYEKLVRIKDMKELLTNKDFGRTTRILFDRLRRKNLDSRIFYSKIENIREHFIFKKNLKKILKDPERFNN